MRILKYIAVWGIAALTGCADNFLELPSKTALSTVIYFQTQSDFEQAINGAYTPLRGLYNGNEGAWAMGEMRSDNTTYKYNPNDRGTISGEYIKDFIEESSNSIPLNKYVADYGIISRVNHLLEPIDEVAFDETAKNNIRGQAYFLRALAYFDLVQYFGSVPLHLKPVKTLDETALPLSDVEEVYAQIISDARQAAALLPGKTGQEPGRATSGAAKMLLGNLYIVQKKWAEAEAILKEITGYSLLPDYSDIYDTNNKNHSESIFEVQYKEGTEGFAGWFFYTFLPQPVTAEEVSAITGIPEVARTIEGYNIPTPDIMAAYEPGDLRKDASVGMLAASGDSCPYIRKYCHPHAQSYNTNDNWPVYRYAETLLFLAEAANEQNKPSEALNYLNQVRNRAGLGNSLTEGQAAIREAILQERRVELAFENKRWLDLVRSNKAEEVMKAYGERVRANPAAYYFPQGFTVAPSAYTRIPYLFALPASEASLSPHF
ncbi:MAG: RagB/SusD family nutrient uptake outer membrane protein [Tannerellaceae bacterium]|jgi:tetratricopeptide (TPR) repeat protein|nr:RagB/SusD family nutrient uptake outer membrane protein [Tannerellaceae bacterium]